MSNKTVNTWLSTYLKANRQNDQTLTQSSRTPHSPSDDVVPKNVEDRWQPLLLDREGRLWEPSKRLHILDNPVPRGRSADPETEHPNDNASGDYTCVHFYWDLTEMKRLTFL